VAGKVAALDFVNRAQVQQQQAVPSTQESLKLAAGVLFGAAIGVALITKVFPGQRVLAAMGILTGGAIFAAAAPVASLAESLGLGASVSGASFLALDIMHEIVPPPGTTSASGEAQAAQASAPSAAPVALRGIVAA
jgi:hypothetical protein